MLNRLPGAARRGLRSGDLRSPLGVPQALGRNVRGGDPLAPAVYGGPSVPGKYSPGAPSRIAAYAPALYETRDTAAAIVIPAIVDSFTLDRYGSAYPRAPAPYKRGAGELSFTDAAGQTFSLDPTGGTVNALWWGAMADGTTNDHSAITAAKAYASANAKTLYFPDGTYKHNSTLTWALANDFRVIGGERVTFLHGGSGVAHDFNGRTVGSATEGVTRCKFGGPNRFRLEGNPAGGTTQVVKVDNWHWGEMKIAPRDGAILFIGEMGAGQAAAVESIFDIYIAQHIGDTFTVAAGYGLFLDQFAACTFINPTVEVCGAGAVYAGYLTNSNGNLFLGGTFESNSAGGVYISSTCKRNTFVNTHNEVNGTGYDWNIDGHGNTFIGIAGAATTLGQRLAGNYNTFEGGCVLESMTIIAGATRNVLENWERVTAFTDGGTDTTIHNETTGTVPDKAPVPAAIAAFPYAGGFANTGAPYKAAVYFRTRAGLVQLEGVMTTGTIAGPTVTGTLPTGYRPSASIVHTCFNLTTNAVCSIVVASTGTVSTRAGVTTGDIISIDGVSFRPA